LTSGDNLLTAGVEGVPAAKTGVDPAGGAV